MSDRIDSAPLQPSRYADASASGRTTSLAQGSWLGEAVQMEALPGEAASLLGSAKEGLTSARRGEMMESKQLDQRMIQASSTGGGHQRAGQQAALHAVHAHILSVLHQHGTFRGKGEGDRVGSASAQRARRGASAGSSGQAADPLLAILEDVPDFDPDAFERLLRDLSDHGGEGGSAQPGPDDMLAFVREHFADPAHADAALAMVELTANDGDSDQTLAEAAHAARARHQAELGPSIRAGLNAGAAAHEAASGDRAAAQALRDGYRDTVFSAAGPSGVYKGILARLDAQDGAGGNHDVAGQIRFLTRALGDDLASEGPSIDPRLLRQLVTDLSALRQIDTVHERCAQLAARIKRQSGVELRVPQVMRALLPLTEEVVSGPNRILPLPGQLGIPAARLDTQILFLRESRDVLAGMPVAVYRDPDARFAALRGLQEAMDIAIEREEASGA